MRTHRFFSVLFFSVVNRFVISGTIAVLCGLFLVSPVYSQTESVHPGINKRYENPKVSQFIKIFERDGRDAFDHRFQVIRACKIQQGMTIADIGAGTGVFTRLFSDAVGPKGTVYAVDIAKNFTEHIKRMAKTEKRTNIRTVVCKQDSVNLPANSIDLAYICDTYHHFEFPQKTMRSLHRALKPNGQIVIVDYHRIPGKSTAWVLKHVRAGQKTFTAEIVKAGFKQIEERKALLRRSYFLRFRKVADKKTVTKKTCDQTKTKKR